MMMILCKAGIRHVELKKLSSLSSQENILNKNKRVHNETKRTNDTTYYTTMDADGTNERARVSEYNAVSGGNPYNIL